MKKTHKIKILLLLAGDYAVLYGTLILSLWLRYYGAKDPVPIKEHYIPFAIIFVLWLFVFGAFGLYDLKFMKNSKLFFYRLLRAVATNTVVTILVLYSVFLPFYQIEPRRNLLIIVSFSTIFISLWRYIFNLLIIKTRASRILFLGINKESLELADFLIKHPQLGQKPVAFMSGGANGHLNQPTLPHLEGKSPIPYFGNNQKLSQVIQDQNIDTTIITREIKENKILVKILFEAIPLGVSVLEFTAFHEMLTGKIPMSLIGEIWFLENLVDIKKRLYEFFKRVLDIIVAIMVSIPAGVLFPFAAFAIKLDSEGPLFFTQKRVGRNGKIFNLIKFRSMVKDAESIGGHKGGGPDPRHTRVGLFLRRSYLDELPQVINILKGEMSFMGPRPERPEYVEKLKQKIPFYEMRLLVPPGITGWAQVNMENDASVEDAPEKMQYDLYYIKNRSFVLDLLIILKTISTLLRREGR